MEKTTLKSRHRQGVPLTLDTYKESRYIPVFIFFNSDKPGAGEIIIGEKKIELTKENLPSLFKELTIDQESKTKLEKLLDLKEEILQIESNDCLTEKAKKKLTFPKKLEIGDYLKQATNAIFESYNYVLKEDRMPRKFTKGIDKKTSFVTSKVVMDRIPYFPQLLEKSELKRFKNGTYKIVSTLQTGTLGTIGLEYSVPYIDGKTPEQIHKDYKRVMLEDAMNTFLHCWHFATRSESFNFLAKITDIMEGFDLHTKDYRFTPEQKGRFWEMLRLLEATRLYFEFSHKERIITANHQMLEIKFTGKEQQIQELQMGYLEELAFSVLDPEGFQEAAQLATKISKGTLNLPDEDIFLALQFQIRAAQRKSYKTSRATDEKYLIKSAGLSKTFEANPSIGRKRLQEKLDRCKAAGAIADWEKTPEGIIYKYNKSKKTRRKQR